MKKTLKTIVRILEVTSCGNCKHLDDRWERAPWDCTEGGLKIRHRDKIHRNCPLDTKKDYLAANAPDQARFQPSPEDGCSAVEYDYCPECRGRFSFNKPVNGVCPWCGYQLLNDLLDESMVTYAHKQKPNGIRFRQYAKDPLPQWAVDVQQCTPNASGQTPAANKETT